MSVHVVAFTRDEFADLLGLDSDENIETVSASYSPMMEEWSLTAWLHDDRQAAQKREAPE